MKITAKCRDFKLSRLENSRTSHDIWLDIWLGLGTQQESCNSYYNTRENCAENCMKNYSLQGKMLQRFLEVELNSTLCNPCSKFLHGMFLTWYNRGHAVSLATVGTQCDDFTRFRGRKRTSGHFSIVRKLDSKSFLNMFSS